jgi:hypothetical protein
MPTFMFIKHIIKLHKYYALLGAVFESTMLMRELTSETMNPQPVFNMKKHPLLAFTHPFIISTH